MHRLLISYVSTHGACLPAKLANYQCNVGLHRYRALLAAPKQLYNEVFYTLIPHMPPTYCSGVV